MLLILARKIQRLPTDLRAVASFKAESLAKSGGDAVVLQLLVHDRARHCLLNSELES